MNNKDSIRRVVMAKRVAKTWLSANASPEYRLTVYPSSWDTRNIPGVLRAFRDGRARIASAVPVPDLGIKATFDRVDLWSRDKDALMTLDEALHRSFGCETSGVY